MEIKIFLDSAELAKILLTTWDTQGKSEKFRRTHIRHALRQAVKDKIEKALNDATYEILKAVV